MNYYQSFITKAPLFNSPDRVSSLDYLEPITREAVLAILADAKAMNIPLLVFETYRSPARQLRLYEQHATELKPEGVHQFGLAADLVKNINGQPSWDGDFNFLAVLAKKHGLISGLGWGKPFHPGEFVDAAHVQRIAVEDQPKLFAGNWWPALDYDGYNSVQVA